MKRGLIVLLLWVFSTLSSSAFPHGDGRSVIGPPRWAVTRGDLHNTTLTATSGKTRFQGQFWYAVGSCGSLGPHRDVLSNFYQNAATSPNQEISNPDHVVLSAVSEVYNNINVIVRKAGSPTITVPSGAADFESDNIDPQAFGVSALPPGALVNVRWEGDIASGTSYVPVGSKGNIGPNDQMFWFTPANDNPQVRGTGPMTAPVGSSSPAIYAPDGIVGSFSAACPAIVNAGDSIGDGGDDTSGVGLNGATRGTAGNINGGGAYRRAPTALGIPFLNMTTGGNRITWIASDITKRSEYFPYFTQGIIEASQNDAAGGSSAATISNAGCTIYQRMFAAGITSGIYQTTTMPKKGGSDNFHQTDIVNQVDIPAYDAIRATLIGGGANSFASKIGATCHLTGVIDVNVGVQDTGDTTAWAVKTNVTTTTAAAITAGDTTVLMTAAPSLSDILVFDVGAATAEEDAWVTNVTGTGPYTVTLSAAMANSHSSGVAVRDTGSFDGTHDTPVNHITMTGTLEGVETTFTAPN